MNLKALASVNSTSAISPTLLSPHVVSADALPGEHGKRRCGPQSRRGENEGIGGVNDGGLIALDLAKSAALGTFPTEAERVADMYDEDPPLWCRDRPPVMNERPCDHEQNGTRELHKIQQLLAERDAVLLPFQVIVIGKLLY